MAREVLVVLNQFEVMQLDPWGWPLYADYMSLRVPIQKPGDLRRAVRKVFGDARFHVYRRVPACFQQVGRTTTRVKFTRS